MNIPFTAEQFFDVFRAYNTAIWPAPCPTTIFTFGILLWSTAAVPLALVVIPLLWSVVGMSAAVSLRVPQDYGLVVAGLAGTALIVQERRRSRSAARA